MSKLWDALKKAEQESKEEIVSGYEEQFEETPEEYAGDLDLTLPPFMAEQYRSLLSTLRSRVRKEGNGFKVMLIVSSRPGEGCTTVATSLAASIAADRSGTRVLLLDANLREPQVHNRFDLPVSPGLVDAVRNHEERMEFFRASPIRGVQNLHILTAGSIDAIGGNPVKVLEDQGIASFFGELRGFYNYIIVDCPAVNSFSDAISLAPLADGAILVVDAQNTRWEVAQRAADKLRAADIKLLGAILNKRKLHIPGSVYKRL